jgi:hypothetical protein
VEQDEPRENDKERAAHEEVFRCDISEEASADTGQQDR